MNYAPTIISRPCGNEDAWRTVRALRIWRETERGPGSIGEQYLASRGIGFGQWQASLRYHSRCPRPRDDAANLVSPLPAIVALVEHAARGPVAVHCTYLRSDGSGKADVERPKAIFGPAAGGAVRFGIPHAGQELAVAEGIETALSVAMACSMPAWAALSAGGIKNLVLPAEATHIVICADHDATGTGERAANESAARWLAEGRRVRIAMPPEQNTDFNDVLIGCAATKTDEARHVA
jgi:hypothetical protein